MSMSVTWDEVKNSAQKKGETWLLLGDTVYDLEKFKSEVLLLEAARSMTRYDDGSTQAAPNTSTTTVATTAPSSFSK